MYKQKQNKVQQIHSSLISIILKVIGSIVVTTLDWEPKVMESNIL